MKNKFKDGVKVKVVEGDSSRIGQEGIVHHYGRNGKPYESDGVVVEFISDGKRVLYRSENSLEVVTEKPEPPKSKMRHESSYEEYEEKPSLWQRFINWSHRFGLGR